MIKLDIDIRAAQSAIAAATAPTLPAQMAEAVANDVVLPTLAQYPQASGRKQPFKSAQARKFFFAGLRQGRITVPYRRSGKLGSEWSKTPDAQGLTLTSQMPYSDMVLTQGKQAAYFAGVWRPDQQLVADKEADAALAATAVLVKAIEGAS